MNLVPIHKLKEASRLLELGNPIVKLEPNKHNRNLAVYFFNGTEKFYRDWKYIKEKNM